MKFITIAIPCGQYDVRNFDLVSNQDSIVRVEKLINEALGRLENGQQYSLFGKTHNYQWGEGYALTLHMETKICVISGVERDVLYPFSVFPIGKTHNAAEYFVWLVGKGKVQINWDLFVN